MDEVSTMFPLHIIKLIRFYLDDELSRRMTIALKVLFVFGNLVKCKHSHARIAAQRFQKIKFYSNDYVFIYQASKLK